VFDGLTSWFIRLILEISTAKGALGRPQAAAETTTILVVTTLRVWIELRGIHAAYRLAREGCSIERGHRANTMNLKAERGGTLRIDV
jgi:hypothetical protein